MLWLDLAGLGLGFGWVSDLVVWVIWFDCVGYLVGLEVWLSKRFGRVRHLVLFHIWLGWRFGWAWMVIWFGWRFSSFERA